MAHPKQRFNVDEFRNLRKSEIHNILSTNCKWLTSLIKQLDVGEQIREITNLSDTQLNALRSRVSEIQQKASKQSEESEIIRRNATEILELTRTLLRQISPTEANPDIIKWRDLLLDFHSETDNLRVRMSNLITDSSIFVTDLVGSYNATVDINKRFKVMCQEAERILSLVVKPIELSEVSILLS